MIDTIRREVIVSICKQVFGTNHRVSSVSKITPISEQGIPRIDGCTQHICYHVCCHNSTKSYVFRFFRDLPNREDRYIHEEGIYRLLSQELSLPVPKILYTDHTRQLVSTNYIIMEYVSGEHWQFLAHSDNPRTNSIEKMKIQEQVGALCAQIHGLEKSSQDNQSFIQTMLRSIENLERCVEDGQYQVSLSAISEAKDLIQKAPWLKLTKHSLYKADAEILFSKDHRQNWDVSAIIDVEAMDFGDPYLDLTNFLCEPTPIWKLEEPLEVVSPEETRKKPLFRGYESVRSIDYSRLAKVCIAMHLSIMCSTAAQIYRPEIRQYINVKKREEIYDSLLDACVSRYLIG